MPSNTQNNSFANATELIGVNAGRLLQNNDLNTTDNTVDYYRFTTSGQSNLKFDVTGIVGGVSVKLYKAPASGLPTEANLVALRNNNTGQLSESYTSTSDPSALANVAAGTYYLAVELDPGVAAGKYNLFVSGSSQQSTNSLLWRDETGSFKSWQIEGGVVTANSTFDATTTVKAPSNLAFMMTGDFDIDGINDILWQDKATSELLIWFMTDGTTVRQALAVTDASGQAIRRGSQWTIGAVGDADGDGAADILWRKVESGEVDIWFMNQDKVSAAVSLLSGGVTASWQVVGFSNADGRLGGDVLWRNSITDEMAIWNLSRSGLETGTRRLEYIVPQDFKMMSFKDLDQDGISDLVWQNDSIGKYVIWKMGVSKVDNFKYHDLGGFQFIGAEDMTGSGRPNMLFWNPISGVLGVATIGADGVSVTGEAITLDKNVIPLPKSASTDWAFEAFQDWNGDRKADLIFRNRFDGNVYYWNMDGSVIIGAGNLKDSANENSKLGSNFIPGGFNYGAYRAPATMQVRSLNLPQVTAGSSRLSAFDIGTLNGTATYIDSVGGSSPAARFDWYKFTVDATTESFISTLSAISANTNRPVKAELYRDDTLITDVAGTTLQPGVTYHIRVLHGNASTQNNDTRYTLTLEGKPGVPNLTAMPGFTTDKTSITLNDTASLNTVDVTSFTIKNTGDFRSPAGAEVGFYLSINGTLELTNDRLLTLTSTSGTQPITNNLFSLGSLQAGAETTLSNLRLTLPTKNDTFWDANNTYQIIAVIDPNNKLTGEKIKTDNAQTRSLALAGIASADLKGKTFSANATSNATPTGNVSGSFTIENIGPRPAGVQGKVVTVKVYLSTDSSIGSGDYLMDTITIPATESIPTNGTSTKNYNVTLPALTDNLTNPTTWDLYWDSVNTAQRELGKNTGDKFTMWTGLVIEYSDDSNTGNNSNLGINIDRVQVQATVTAA